MACYQTYSANFACNHNQGGSSYFIGTRAQKFPLCKRPGGQFNSFWTQHDTIPTSHRQILATKTSENHVGQPLSGSLCYLSFWMKLSTKSLLSETGEITLFQDIKNAEKKAYGCKADDINLLLALTPVGIVQQRLTWGRKAPGFGWAAFEWASFIIDTFVTFV